MPINTPETDAAIAAQEGANQGDFSVRNLPSPGALPLPQMPVFGTGDSYYQNRNTEQGNAPVQGTNVDANFLNKVLGTKEKPYTVGNLPTYSQQEVYNPRYSTFLPGADNEARAANAQSTADKWGNAFVKFGATAIGTFYNGMTALPSSIQALKGNNVYSDPNSNSIDIWLKNLEDQFPNYYTKWEQDHPFMSALPFSGGFANFWGDKMLKNLGFTVGAIGSAVVQDLVIGGLTGGVGEIPMAGAQVGKAALWLNKIFGAGKIAALGAEVGATEGAILAAGNLKRVSGMSKLWDGTRYALNSYAAAASEAGFEARDGYNTVKNDLLTAYQREKGYDAMGKDLDDIEKEARASANTRFGINLVILGVSNAVQFDNLLKPWSVAKTGARSTIEQDLGEAGKIVYKEGKFQAVDPTKAVKAYAAIRPILANVLAEGVYEEGGQYAAQVGTQNYYERKYLAQHGLGPQGYATDKTPFDARNDFNELLHSTIEGMKAEFGTTEGLENIFLGALTGVVSHGAKVGYDRFSGKGNPEIEKRDATIDFLNKVGITGVITNTYDSAVKSARIAEDMKAAVKAGDLFKYKNFQHEMFSEFILSGLQAGRFDVRMEQLDLLKDMDQEKFKQAFGMDKTDADVKTVDQYVTLMKQKAQDIKRTYDIINDTFGNPFNQKSKNALEVERYNDYENYKNDLTYLSSIQKDVINRQTNINTAVKQIHPGIDMNTLRTLTDRNALKEYVGTLQDTYDNLIKAAEVKESPTRKQDAKEATKVKKHLDSINNVLADPKPSNEAYTKMFSSVLNYDTNGYNPNKEATPAIDIPLAAIPTLINYGRDSNRLTRYQQDAQESFEALATDRGLNNFFANYADGRRQWRKKNPFDQVIDNTDNPFIQEEPVVEKPAPTPEGTTETTTPTPPSPIPTVTVTSKDGNTSHVFEQGEEYNMPTGEKDEKGNDILKPVEVVSSDGNTTVVKTPDGEIIEVPNDEIIKNFEAEREAEREAEEVLDAQPVRDSGDIPPTNEDNARSPSAKDKGGFTRDVISYTRGSKSPSYYGVGNDNNWQQRHERFLFNIPSRNSKIFNQENRDKLRAIYVNARIADKMGFPKGWISTTDEGYTGENEPLRIIYVVYEPKERKSYFIDEHGNKLRDITSGNVDSDKLQNTLIYTNATDARIVDSEGKILKVEKDGELVDMVTNKNNLNPKALQDEYYKKRRELLAQNDFAQLQAMQFEVSRGIPNIRNDENRNSVTSVGLVEHSDFDRASPIISVVTGRNEMELLAVNNAGEISPILDSIPFRPGRALLNPGLTISWLNARMLINKEARNIYEVIRQIPIQSKDRGEVTLTQILDYLRGIIYMDDLYNKDGTPRGGTDSSIVYVPARAGQIGLLYLGKDRGPRLNPKQRKALIDAGQPLTGPIRMNVAELEQNKDRIIKFLSTAFHNVDNAKLTPTAWGSGKTPYVTLKVEDGKLSEDHTYDNYQHYLMSDKETGRVLPLTSNIAKEEERQKRVVEGEPVPPPYIGKYIRMVDSDFNATDYPAAPAPTSVTPAPTPPTTPKKATVVATTAPKATVSSTTPSNATVTDIEKAITANQKLVEGKTEDNNFYIINGEKYNRVTTVIGNEFKGDASKYEGARIAGNTIDGIIRQFFSTGTVTKPEGIVQSEFDKLIEGLNAIKANIAERGERFLTNNIVLFDEKSKVAGEVDILAVDKHGSFSIYDIKTSKDFKNYEHPYDDESISKRELHTRQLSVYANLFRNQYGKEIKKLGILPIEIQYKKNGEIGFLKKMVDKEGKLEKQGIVIKYDDEFADTVVPPIATKATSTTKAQAPKAEPTGKKGTIEVPAEVQKLAVEYGVNNLEFAGGEAWVGDVERNDAGKVISLILVAVQNPETGQILDIPDDQVDSISRYVIDTINKSIITKDTTNSNVKGKADEKLKDAEEGDADEAFRSVLGTGGNYEKINIDAEYGVFKHVVGSKHILNKLDHILRKTNGGFAWGAVRGAMLYIYEQAPSGTIYHEAFEAVWGNYLTGKEQQELYDEFLTKKGTFRTFNDEVKNYSDATLKEAKEQMAEDFAAFRLNKDKAGEALKTTPKLLQWFNNLVNFIRKIIFGPKDEINGLFNRMNQGYYRNYSNIVNSPTSTAQYSTARHEDIKHLPELIIQDTIQGMHIMMMQSMFRDGADIVEMLENKPKLYEKELYDNLLQKVGTYFESDQKGNFRSAIKARRTQIEGSVTKGDRTREQADIDLAALDEQFLQIDEKWQEIKAHWDAFVFEHKRFLKMFNVNFRKDARYQIDDEGNVTEADDDPDNREEDKTNLLFTPELGKIDGKNSSSSAVKLLLAAVAESVWKHATEAALSAIDPNVIYDKKSQSSVGMPKAVQYAKLFNYILHTSANIGNVYDILDNLNSIVNDIPARKDPDANIQAVMNMINWKDKKGFSDKNWAQTKMILKIEAAWAKNKPNFDGIYINETGEVYRKQSVLNSKINQEKDRYISGIKASGILIPGTEDTEGWLIIGDKAISRKTGLAYLNHIGINITNEEYKKIKGGNRSDFIKAANAIKSELENKANEKDPHNKAIEVASGKSLDFDNRLGKIAEIYINAVSGDDSQSQHPNPDGEQTSSFILDDFVMTVLNDLNNSEDKDVDGVKTTAKDDFLAKIGNSYFRDIFHADAHILNYLFDENGNRRKDSEGIPNEVRFTLVDGVRSWDGTANKSTAKLSAGIRRVNEINHNNRGVFYTLLPGDAISENAISSSTFIDADRFFKGRQGKAEQMARFHKQMGAWLKTEIRLAHDYKTNLNRRNIVALDRESTFDKDRTVGNSLRFFQDYLPKDIVDKIHKQIVDAEDFETALNNLGNIAFDGTPEIFNSLMDFMIQQKATNTTNFLKEWHLFETLKEGRTRVSGMDKEFLTKYLGPSVSNTYTDAALNELMKFREINYLISNIDMHKMFFGDPAQYLDELKRIKSFMSGRENTHVDIYHGTPRSNEGLNANANITRNMAGNYSKPNEMVILKPNDPGYKEWGNHLNTLTLEEVYSASGENKAYQRQKEGDSGAMMLDTAWREMMIKAGARWTEDHETNFQIDQAWKRRDMAKEKLYEYTDNELKRLDNELADQPYTKATHQPLKLVHSGIQTVNNTAIASIDKASWTYLSYRELKEQNRAFYKLYLAMEKAGIDYVRMESAHKVGIQKNSLTPLYDEEGNINSEGIQGAKAEQVQFKHIGVQVEQAKKENGVTQGSQARAEVTTDILTNGVPNDYIEKHEDAEVAHENWYRLSEADKLDQSEDYRQVKEHDESLVDLINIKSYNKMKQLGIKTTLAESTNVEDFSIEDKTKLSKFILRELERRLLPRNIAYGLGINEETGDFNLPLEANAQYAKIRQIIYSTVENTVQRPKMNGGMKTMVPVTGMETGARIRKDTINGKPVWVSAELKDYEITEDGKKVNACEVLLPYAFGEKLRLAQKRGAPIKTKAEILAYLKTAEGKELLKGIGFRIPTQGLNSIDSFIIKDFLPEGMGDSIVFPASIVTKAGSDFDIDKMNIYLRNFYIDHNSGFPKVVKTGLAANLDTNNEQALTDYYEKYMRPEFIAYNEYLKRRDIEQRGGKLLDLIKNKAEEKGIRTKHFEDLKELESELEEEERDRDEDEPDYVPDINEFIRENKGRPAGSLLNLQAAENRYMDAMEALILNPRNYKRLTTPNDATPMSDLSDYIVKLKSNNLTEAEQRALDISKQTYGRLTDSGFMSSQRHTYLESKGLVGIAAVANKFHALAQKVNGGLQYWGDKVKGWKMWFPHNEVGGNISLSGGQIKGSDMLISHVISMTIDGGVDIVKNPWLSRMGITKDNIGVFLALVRSGVRAKMAALFINQPMIQEYLKRKQIAESVPSVNINFEGSTSEWGIADEVKRDERFNKPHDRMVNHQANNYSIEEMEGMIKTKNLTKEQRATQWNMLSDFLSYNQMSWDLFNYYQGFNWDTGNFSDPNLTRIKNLAFLRAKLLDMTDITKMMQTDEVKEDENGNKVITRTYLGAMRNRVWAFDRAFKSTIRVQTGIAGDYLTAFAREMVRWFRPTMKIKLNSMLKKEMSIIDFANLTSTKGGRTALVDQIPELLLGHATTAHYVQALQESKVKYLVENPFIANLQPNIDSREGYPSTVTLKSREFDPHTSDIWTDNFSQMRDDAVRIYLNEDDDSTAKTVGEIYDMLVRTFILQFGAKRTNNSAVHLTPNDTYSAYTSPNLEVMNLTGYDEVGAFYRNNIRDPWIVPQVEEDYKPEGASFTDPYEFRSAMTVAVRELMIEDKGEKFKRPFLYSLKVKENKSLPFVKIWDEINKKYILLKRVTLKGGDGFSVNKGRIVYKPVNSWGSGIKDHIVQEHYSYPRASILTGINTSIDELSDDYIIDVFNRAGVPSNSGIDTSLQATELNNEVLKSEDDDLADTSETTDEGDGPTRDITDTEEGRNFVERITNPYKSQKEALLDHDDVAPSHPRTNNHSMYFTMPASENLTGKDTTTLALAEEGLRTATTRNYALGKVGDIITFEGRPQQYRITGVEKLTLRNILDDEWVKQWSQKEQWTVEHFHKILGGPTVHGSSWQTSFVKVGEENKAEAVPTPTPVVTTSNNPSDFVNHSGGAIGSDKAWDDIGRQYGVTKHNHYWYGEKTPNGNVQITKEQLEEGWQHVLEANKTLKRKPEAYKNLLSRNWQQVKNADAVFAIGDFNQQNLATVDGGTGWAVQMAVDAGKPVFVYGQDAGSWFRYDYDEKDFVETDTPTLTRNFAGIGTRKITVEGRQAIEDVYRESFNTQKKASDEVNPNQLNLFGDPDEEIDCNK